MDSDIMLSWNLVGYQSDGYVAHFNSEDNSKQILLPMTIDSPYISATMTQFSTVTGRLSTEGGTCYLQNSDNYSSFIINLTNIMIDLLPRYAKVYYRG